MPYTLTDYSNKQIGNGLTVSDYSVDTSTILDLVGKGNVDYSNSIFENFIYLLSNFSNPFPPGTNFSTNYQENNNWLPTITASASSTMESSKTNIVGTLWYQSPEINICSNSIANLIKGCIEMPSDATLANNLNSAYDPNNYFTNNSDAVYGQELSSSGILWIYTGKVTSNIVSPNIVSINGNLYATYDPALLGWEAYSSITVSTNEPSNRYAIWLNMNDSCFYYYDVSTTQWARIGTPTSIEPTEDNTGTLVSDGTLWVRDGQLWMKNSSLETDGESYPPLFQNNNDSSTISNGWILIGPQSPIPESQVSGTTNGYNGTDSRYAVLIDTDGNNHDNILWFDGGLLIAIVSKDKFTISTTTPVLGGDTFTPSISGFEVYPGVNLVNSSYYFNGNIIADGTEYATKAYVDEVATGAEVGYTPVQQGGGTNMNTNHVYIGQSSDGNSLLAQVGSQQLGSFAFQSWVNSNYLSLTNGGVISGPVSLNGGSTAVTVSYNDNSTNIATTAYVKNNLGNYLPISGGTLTGNLTTNGKLYSSTNGQIFYYGENNSYNFSLQNDGSAVFNANNSSFISIKNTGSSFSSNVTFNGNVYAQTMTTTDNSTNIATTAYVKNNLGNYLYTTSNSNNTKIINSTIDTNYTLPTFEDSSGRWYILPDINYLNNNYGNFLKKSGDSATGRMNFMNGISVPTQGNGDSSNNAASTAFVYNVINNKINSNKGDSADHQITNFIQSNNWTGNGSAGLGLWDDTGAWIGVADINWVESFTRGNFNANNPGYQVFSSGLIIQWGTGQPEGLTNFPITFPNGCFVVLGTNNDTQGIRVDNTYAYIVNNSQFYINTKSSNGSGITHYESSWLAIGH